MAFHGRNTVANTGTAVFPAVSANDAALMFICQDGATTPPTTPSGWTHVAAIGTLSGPDGGHYDLYYKTALCTGSETTVAVTLGTGVTTSLITIVTLSNRTSATPSFTGAGTLNTTANNPAGAGFSLSTGGGTAVAGDDVVLFVGFDPTAAGPATYNLSSVSNGLQVREETSTNWLSVATWSANSVSAGATGSITATVTGGGGTTAGYAAITIAFPGSPTGSGPSTDNIPLDTAVTTPRPHPILARAVDVVAPVGTLIAAAGLSSLGWGPTTPAPPRSTRANVQAQQPSQPVGTGIFALTKIPHDAVALPRQFNQPQRVVDVSSPVGAPISTPVLGSLGWLQIGTSAPSPAPRLVFSDIAGPLFQSSALSSIGWLSCDPPPRNALAAARSPQGPSAPEAPLTPFVSLSFAWGASTPIPFDTPLVTRPVGESSPVGTLFPAPLVSLSWLVTDLPLDTPLKFRQVAESSPTGVLLTPQPFGWHAEHQVRPAPLVPRKVEPSAPVGTAFAIALPSNGWLATDNPRTPLALGKSAPTDPVGNLLFVAPLPNLSWLVTENPRTPLKIQPSVTIDPVGPKMALPGALGPYWHVDLPARAVNVAPRVAPTDPIGSTVATLTSLGWLSPFEPPRAPIAARRPQPTEPISALQFGGTPWAGIDIAPGHAAVARMPSESAPVGSPFAGQQAQSIGWLTVELAPRRQVFARALSVAEPIGTPILPPAPIGWLTTDTRAPALTFRRPQPSEPVGLLIPPPVLPSMGFQSFVDLPPVWRFVARPIPSEPVGTPIGFQRLPADRSHTGRLRVEIQSRRDSKIFKG